MGSGTLETNRLTNGEAENSLHHKQADNARARDCNDAVAEAEELSRDAPGKRARLRKELTFQDMYQNDGAFDDDGDDDDSDWEPFQLHKCVEIKKWFCKNCTMVNLDSLDCCHICEEHRDSKILSQGFFASPFAQDEDLAEVQGNAKGLKDVGSQESVAYSSTAIGFDERMLLHAESTFALKLKGSLGTSTTVVVVALSRGISPLPMQVYAMHVEKKSPPHPERPDRLRAIAASLAKAGIFPGKCYSIPAREITPEELVTWSIAAERSGSNGRQNLRSGAFQ
ncbi:Histone deacetylase 15, partial [Mucuna pruriens]